MDQRQAFFVLGLSGMVTKEQVKKRYRDLCKKLHPDDNSSKEAYEQYLLVQEAYQWMEQYYRYVVQQPRVFGQVANVPKRKVVDGWPVSQPRYSDRQYRQKQVQKLEKEQERRRKEEAERKRKVWEAMQNARKLPSQREAEKWKKIEMQREAERIAEIIKQLMALEENSNEH